MPSGQAQSVTMRLTVATGCIPARPAIIAQRGSGLRGPLDLAQREINRGAGQDDSNANQ